MTAERYWEGRWRDESAENGRLRQWVADLQSGMYVNCVYCGHRYGPGETTPVSMADALKVHIAKCQQHPVATIRAETLETAAKVAEDAAALQTQDEDADLRNFGQDIAAEIRALGLGDKTT